MFIVVAIFMFPLMLFPAAAIVEKYMFTKRRRSGKKWQKNTLRTFLVVLCGAVAVLSGNEINSMVAVIGGLFCVPLALVYPPLFYLRSGRAKSLTTQIIPAAINLICGILAALLSSGSAIYNIIR